MKVVRWKITQQQVTETVRDLRLWRIEFVEWIAAHRPMPASMRRYMRDEIPRARCDIRLAIALAMIAGMCVPVTQRWTSRPRGPTPGWRMQRRRMNIMKIYTRGIGLHTIADMLRALDNLEKLVARAKKEPAQSDEDGRARDDACVGEVLAACGLAPARARPRHVGTRASSDQTRSLRRSNGRIRMLYTFDFRETLSDLATAAALAKDGMLL